jgi:hypothetical protein
MEALTPEFGVRVVEDGQVELSGSRNHVGGP